MESSKGFYIPQIDALRGLAFFLVVIVHFSVPTWNSAISGSNLAWVILESVIKCGWFGVPIFLFISGYSLALGKVEAVNTLSISKFYINRLLRIYPLYFLCISVLAFTHHLSGVEMASLAFFQTQDIPKTSPFRLLWSIQLEFTCYLLFPVFLSTLRSVKDLAYIFLALVSLRLGLYFLPSSLNYQLSYSTIFGGATLFLAGMVTAAYPVRNRLLFFLAVFLLIALSIFLTAHGGYQAVGSDDLKWVWIFFPELFSVICFFLVSGFLSFAFRGLLANVAAHIGKISYSGYVFHLFVLDFWRHLFPPTLDFSSGAAFFQDFLMYFSLLLVFSHISYHSFELVFLRFRKSYY